MSDQFGPINDDLAKQLLKDLTTYQGETKRAEWSPAELRYRAAAAVLSSFDPTQIKPVQWPGEETWEDEVARSALLAVSEPVYTKSDESRWTLREQARLRAFNELGTKEAITRALEANPLSGRDDPLQRMLFAYTSESPPSLEHQSLDELLSTANVTQWLQGILSGLPAPQDVADQIELVKILTPLRELVSDNFRGRSAELALLRDYVGILTPRTVSESARRLLRVYGRHERLPLCVDGPGGVGKSTLLAKFVLDHVDVDASQRTPFVYLDFDRPGLTPQEPLTLLLESARQLGVQYPAVREQADHLRQSLLDRLASLELRLLRVEGRGTRSDRLRELIDPEPFLRGFADVASQAASERPVLFVLDTFEAVQIRGFDTVRKVWELLVNLQALLPRLRLVLVGRAPIDGMSVEHLSLSGFDKETARGYLAALLAPDVILNDDELSRIIEVVGGNVLSLKIAGDLIRKDGPNGIVGRRLLLFASRPELVQAALYQRILDHIVDLDVRRLVHLGPVVRRLIPPVIRHVLAEPCGVEVPTDERAEELFQACSREVALLSMESDGSLHYRPDVRRMIIPLIRADQPHAVRQIHRRAISFYRRQGDHVSRAEEIYHRLSLGQSSRTIDKYWEPGIEPYLSGSIEELPPGGQAYLAARLGIALDPAVLREADLSTWDWERHAARRVKQLLAFDEAELALDVLHERTDRSAGSPLFTLEGEALERLGRLLEASHIIDEGLSSAAQSGDQGILLDLTYLAAGLQERLGHHQRALELLSQAWDLGRANTNLIMLLKVGVAQLRLADPEMPNPEKTRREVAAILTRIPLSRITSESALLVELAAEFGEDYPELLKHTLDMVGLQGLDREQRYQLAEALKMWDEELSGRVSARLPSVVGAAAVADVREVDSWVAWFAGQRTSRLAGVLSELLASLETRPVILRALADLYRKVLEDVF